MPTRCHPRLILFTLAALLAASSAANAQPIRYDVVRSDDSACAADPGTLRWAIDSANADGVASEVRFAPAIFGQTIRLECPLLVEESLSLFASPSVVVDGSNLAGMTVLSFGGIPAQSHSVQDLQLRGGTDTQGVAITLAHTVSMVGCRIYGNALTAAAATPDGAGVHLDDGKLLLDRCLLYYNSAAGDGGAILVDQGQLYIVRTRLDKNTAALGGGGIAFRGLAGSLVQVDGSTFYSNLAGQGGAIAVYSGNLSNALTVVNSTFTSNGRPAGGTGGAIYGNRLFGPNPVRISLTSSTFSLNLAATGSTLALVPGAGNVLRAYNTILDKPAGASAICSGTDFGGHHDIWDDTSCALGTVQNGSKPNTNPMVSRWRIMEGRPRRTAWTPPARRSAPATRRCVPPPISAAFPAPRAGWARTRTERVRSGGRADQQARLNR